MKQVAVIGLGNWGTALANHLAIKNCSVLAWSIEPEIVEGINTRHVNPRCFSQVTLHERVRATGSLDDIVHSEAVVLVLPAAALPEVVPRLKVSRDAVIVSAIKGLAGDSLLTPLQYFARFGAACRGLAVLSGPSFARDIIIQRPAGVVAASAHQGVAKEVAALFTSDWLKVYTSNDPLGVELGGIFKNVIAIAVGACDGLQLGDSARAGLITRGLAEMMRMAKAMGADVLTLSGLSGLGDLVMTATCDASRNRTVGLCLGRGEKLSDILASLGSVAEGVYTTPYVLALAKRHGVEMPISEQVGLLLNGQASAGQVAKALISRPIKPELAGLQEN